MQGCGLNKLQNAVTNGGANLTQHFIVLLQVIQNNCKMTDTGSFYNGTGKGRQTWQEVLAYYETYLNKAEAYKQATLTAEYTAMCFPFSVLATTWKAAQADAPPPPPPQDIPLLHDTGCESYGAKRLQFLGLTAADGFRVDTGGTEYGKSIGTDDRNKPIFNKINGGGIAIRYHYITGEPVTYIALKYRKIKSDSKAVKPAGIEPRTVYERIRLTPYDTDAVGYKYISPSNYETDKLGTLTFFPLQVRQAYKAAQHIPVLTATEGEIKAAVCAKHYGIPAISFSGNTVYRLCDDTKKLITRTQPGTFVINYDSDAVRDDRNKADEYGRRYGFFNSFVKFTRQLFDFQTETGRQFNVLLCIPTGKGGKGIDDILQSEPEAAAAYKSGVNSRFFTFYSVCVNSFVSIAEAVFLVHRQYYKHIEGIFLHGTEGEYLTDILKRYGIPITPEGICGRQWNVPTGTGKTYLAAQVAKVAKVVLCVPYTPLAEAIADKYGAALWIGKKKSDDIQAAQFIVCNYRSFRNLFNVISPGSYHLFIDEIHNTAADYLCGNLSYIAERAELFASVTTLTGTPFAQFCKAFQLPQVNVTVPRKAKRFYIYDCKEVRKAAAVLFKKSVAAGRIPVLILNDTNDSGKLGALKCLLQDMTGIATLNSYTKDSAQFQAIVQTRRLHSGTEGIITTSVLKEGNDIDDAAAFDFIVIGNHHVNDLEQFANRSRNGTDIAVYWLRSLKAKSNKNKFNVYFEAAEYIKLTRQQIDILNAGGHTPLPETPAAAWYKTVNNIFNSFPIKHTADGYELDGLRLNADLFKMELFALCANVDRFCERLQLLGYSVHRDTLEAAEVGIKQFEVKIECDKQETAEIKTAKELAQEAERLEVAAVIDEIDQAADVHLITDRRNRRSLTKTETILFNSYIKLMDVCSHSAAIDHLKRCGLSKSKHRDTLQRASIQRIMLDGAELRQTRPEFAAAMVAVYERLRTGKAYEPAQLYAELLDCLKVNTAFNDFKLRNGRQDNLLRLLRLFFDVTIKSVKQAGKVSKCIVLTEIDQAAMLGTEIVDVCVHCLADNLQSEFLEIVPF